MARKFLSPMGFRNLVQVVFLGALVASHLLVGAPTPLHGSAAASGCSCKLLCGAELQGEVSTLDYLSLAVDSLGRIPVVFHVIRDDTGGGGFKPPGGDVAGTLASILRYTNDLFPDVAPCETAGSLVFRRFEFYVDQIIDGRDIVSHRNSDYLEVTDDEGNDRIFSFGSLIDLKTACSLPSASSSHPRTRSVRPSERASPSWFNLVAQGAIRRGTFRSVKELVHKIGYFVEQYNRDTQPFVWTATADSILEKIKRLCQRISETGHQHQMRSSISGSA
jgi:hypothetical protein